MLDEVGVFASSYDDPQAVIAVESGPTSMSRAQDVLCVNEIREP